MDGLDPHYDAIVIGTGLVESIVSAALAKDGKSVLHLDKNPYYGGEWATFNFEKIMDWAATTSSLEESAQPEVCLGSDFDPVILLEIIKQARHESRKAKAEKERQIAEHEKQQSIDKEGVGEEKGVSSTEDDSNLKDEINEEEYNGWELECIPVLSQPRSPSIISQKIDCAETNAQGINSQLSASPSHPSWEQKSMQADETQKPEGLDSAAMHPAFFGYSDPPPPDPRPNLEQLLYQSRSFSLDLTAKLILGSGVSVDTMVRSGIGRYMEFKSIEGLYLGADQNQPSSNNSKFIRVPCLKGDVAKSKLMTVVEKRLLMRFLQYCTEWGRQQAGEDVTTQNERELGQGRSLNRPQNKEHQASKLDAAPFIEQGRPFEEFLESCRLTPHVQRLVVYALALTSHSVPLGDQGPQQIHEKSLSTLEGLQAISRHLRGLGQYGETAFLASLYGSSEIPQAFCRTAAVNGAIYILDNSISSIVREKHSNQVVGVVDQSGSIISCNMLVCSPDYLYQILPSEEKVLRRISVCTASPEEKNNRLAFVLPPNCLEIQNPSPIHVISLDHGAEVCPPGLKVVHFTTVQDESSSKEVLSRAASHLFGNWPSLSSSPDLPEEALGQQTCHEAWALDFSIPLHTCPPESEESLEDSENEPSSALPANLAVSRRISSELCMFDAFEQAEVLFGQLCPGRKFFPQTKFQDAMMGEEDFDSHLLEYTLEKAGGADTTVASNANNKSEDDSNQSIQRSVAEDVAKSLVSEVFQSNIDGSAENLDSNVI